MAPGELERIVEAAAVALVVCNLYTVQLKAVHNFVVAAMAVVAVAVGDC